MTDKNPDLGNDEDMPSPTEILRWDAGTLAGLLEGLEVLNERACGPDCGLATQARDSIAPILIVAIEKAWKLSYDLAELEPSKPRETLQ